METTKPMWKTASFWIAIVLTNIGLLLTNHVIGDGSVTQVLGWIMTVATVLGYKALPAAPAETPTTPTV